MSVPYKDAGFELKFLGTMNGSSSLHTNAYFYPEKDVMAFIDLSLLNYEKASYLITPNLKRVILFLTHLHDDHASGVLSLAFLVREKLGVLLEVMTGSYFTQGAFQVFYETGGKPIFKNGELSEVLHIYGQTFDGRILTRPSPESAFLVEQELILESQQFKVPSWFVKTVPTVHSPRLSGAVGFVFMLNGKAIVYSGDTNTADPFFSKAENYAIETGDEAPLPVPTELYLEAQTGANITMHLSFDKIRSELLALMRRAPLLRVALMHYNDYGITHEVTEFNRELGEERLFVALQESPV